MLCPNCHIDHPEDIHECPKCGLVLGKWHGGKVSAGHAIGASREQKSSPVVLYGGLFVMVVAYFAFFRGGPAEDESASAPAPIESSVPGFYSEREEIENPWRFEGQVMDVRKADPIKDAKIAFYALGKAFHAVTDADGKYHLPVASLVSGAYDVAISHPKYDPQWVEGSPLLLPDEMRKRMDCAKSAVKKPFTGSLDGPTTADFMLCPKR